MKTIQLIVARNAWGIPQRLKLLLTRLGSLVLLFQRMPVVQFLFPEAGVIGGASVANSIPVAVTTVVGLGVFDSVAGQSQINQKAPLSVLGRDPAGTSPTAANAINVPATVSAPLTFSFNWDPANDYSTVKSWRCTTGGVVETLPDGLSPAFNAASSVAIGGLISITGTPTSYGITPVTVTVYKRASYASDYASQIFNICVLGFSTQPAASTTIDSGQTTTLTCVVAGNPVGTTWHPGNGVLTYEWYEGTSGTLGTILGTSASFTTPILNTSTNYWVRAKSVLGASTVYANSATAVVTVNAAGSPFDTWASGLPQGQNGAMNTPQGDGVTNLEKFAFNLDPLVPDVRHLTAGAGETAGLPGGIMAGGVLRIEFLRRKASTNPGIAYTAQFGSDLGGWSDITTGTPAGTSIDATWERVVVDDPAGGPNRFGRVKVEQVP